MTNKSTIDLISIDHRQAKLEEVIEKLTDVSANLNKLIAVQEQRLSQQEKTSETLQLLFENRRQVVDNKFESLYEVLEKRKTERITEIENFRKDNEEKFSSIHEKIYILEKYVWMAIGACTIISFFVTTFGKLLIK